MIATFVPVTVGVTNAEVAHILTPPLSGAVVTLGQHLLEDGSRITLPQQQPPKQADGEHPQPQEGKRPAEKTP